MKTKRIRIDKDRLLDELNYYNKLNDQLCGLNWLDRIFKKPHLTLMRIQCGNRIIKIVEPLVSEMRQKQAEKEWIGIMEKGGIIEVNNNTFIPNRRKGW